MKILITSGIFAPDIGGPASYAAGLARHISKKHEVTVITYSPVRRFAGDKELPFKVVRVWKIFPKGIRHLVYLLTTLRLSAKNDIVYALNAVSAGVPALLAAKIKHKKFFVKIVGDYAWEMSMNSGEHHRINDFQQIEHTGKTGIIHRLQKWVCMNATGIIVPSSYLAGLVRGWGVPADKIKVIYNGVDFKSAGMPKKEARMKIGISGNILLSVGRLVPWKGFRMLIKVMPQLLQINQFFRLVIVGKGPELTVLQTMIKNLGLERKVFLVGSKNHAELAVYLAAADIFILNTGYEGFSHQILEAMAAGVPIITTAVGGNKEVIEQSENGFMIKYNDEFNLVEAIKGLWEMEDLREKFIKEGLKTAKKYTMEKMYSETIKILTG